MIKDYIKSLNLSQQGKIEHLYKQKLCKQCKLATRVSQTKKKQTFQPGNAHFTVKLPAVEMFFSEKRVCELSMFPQYMQTYYGILCFSRVKKLHTALLITIHCVSVSAGFYIGSCPDCRWQYKLNAVCRNTRRAVNEQSHSSLENHGHIVWPQTHSLKAHIL